MRISDRSRYETTMSCARKRYWNYEHKGRGLVGPGIRVDLLYGTGIHNGMDELIRTNDMDAAINHLKTALAQRVKFPIPCWAISRMPTELLEPFLQFYNVRTHRNNHMRFLLSVHH